MKNYSIMLLDEEIQPCAEIIKRAEQYYKKPVKDLKLKAPLEKLYLEADTDEPIGQWVTNVPKPGDVAACANFKSPKKGRAF